MLLEFKTPLKGSINIIKDGYKIGHFSFGYTFHTMVKRSPKLYVFLCLLPVQKGNHCTLYEELIVNYESK